MHKVFLTFKSVDEILICDRSNVYSQKLIAGLLKLGAVLSCGAMCYIIQGDSTFLVCGCIQMKAVEQYFPVMLFVLQYLAK